MRSLDPRSCLSLFFFFNDTATTEIYTLSLHDALPISSMKPKALAKLAHYPGLYDAQALRQARDLYEYDRSEEHTSELQSPDHLVCRLLLEKKKKQPRSQPTHVTKVEDHTVNQAIRVES